MRKAVVYTEPKLLGIARGSNQRGGLPVIFHAFYRISEADFVHFIVFQK